MKSKAVKRNQKFNSKSNQESFRAPVKSDTSLGKLHYTDPDKIGRGYIEDQEPTVDMVAGRTIEKSFFLKVWWNEFVRYVNENYNKKSQWNLVHCDFD